MNQTNILIITLWCISIALVFKYKKWFYLLIPYAIFVLNECAFIATGMSVYQDKDITENFYDLSILSTRYGHIDHNYSEGYYPNDDYNITPKQAEVNKFNKILEYLGAEKGDVILDMGCGTCSFGEYCATKGIHVIGLTLSSEQVKLCEHKKVEALQRNFMDYHPELAGVADHILILGSSEHIATGPHNQQRSFIRKHEEMQIMLKHCKKYVKSNPTKPQRVFFSGLHLNEKFADTWEVFVLQRSYGGTLMLNAPELDIVSAADAVGIKKVAVRDSTKEYFLATALNEHHFGNPAPFASKYMVGLLVLGLLYPYGFYMYVYYVCGIWMWMFDWNLHFESNKNYNLKSMDERPCTLWWYVGEISSPTKQQKIANTELATHYCGFLGGDQPHIGTDGAKCWKA